ncbi:transporter substrate-binding domain-containing protein [Zoogloea sp.]|jgi:polar amino acid transport system substrate-binding protein|uniref:transporter substrate-binding domain-containing protein n=1 Tax=Zoogloea sp. TaxID=49181 RepID=UPI0035AEF82E
MAGFSMRAGLHGLLLVLLLMPGLAAATLLNEIRAQGRLRVAIAGALPPYNHYTPDGTAQGSDADIARAMARDLGVRLEVVRVVNSDRVAALLARRADVVISALSISPERERLIAFSVPYATIDTVIAAPPPLQLSSPLDLRGRRVGVLAGSANAEHLLQNAPGVKLLSYAEHDRLVEAYLAGEFEILSVTRNVVDEVNARRPPRPLVEHFRQMEFEVAVGMPRGEKALRDWINAWIVVRLRDHTLAGIHLRHHGRRLLALPGAAGR